ncbi:MULTISPECIES: DUF3718 domain-containing protein [Pseudoalteromonas]|jgi:hypothetical protein|uniref:DUF3718 domain-containing protein n=1 Tax=Pseudoalteromonas lipolytica TaxID=570156 RepID=A0AAD0S1A1_9GAMM|nr:MULTISPECIES: DUF3718 domain-containing protein [Pseudoalteromonas]AXV66245.1 DUF3718 domain-containing protein [Pseudoalteromonas donghaensis]EWH07878.1 hypothetical protein AT00_00235 [Pseudoalteromonas lipolytica SCSIO 04301]MAE02094.1 DUF3718 domain-containing protein [Pseudoalteromonas sp.]MBE0350603.1 hypothetical protein [Pseudoalteromonas lipolytica LMEB 39]MBE0350605.1 hypothetical protein [Pseudoalteromonas lipolytica LMEB 39]
MMKLPNMLLAAAVVTASVAYTAPVKADDQQLALSLCEYIAADDKNRLRDKLKSSRVKIRNIIDAFKCNDNNMLRHAIVSGANDTGEYIVKRLPSSSFEDGADIAWAEANGFGGSPVVAAIKERAGL